MEGDGDPFQQFGQWFREADDSEIPDPTIMALATAGGEGKPSVRIVLLKEFDERGLSYVGQTEIQKKIMEVLGIESKFIFLVQKSSNRVFALT